MKKVECDHCGDRIIDGDEKFYEEIGIVDNNSWSNFGKQIMTFKVEFLRVDDDHPDLCSTCFRRDAKEQFERMMNSAPAVPAVGSEEDIPF